jgi:hypothetical protein
LLLVSGIIAVMPFMLCFIRRSFGSDVIFARLILSIPNCKRIVEIMLVVFCVWLGGSSLSGLVALSNFLRLIVGRVRASKKMLGPLQRNAKGHDIHKMLRVCFIPSWTTLFTRPYTLNIFSAMVFHDKVNQILWFRF